MKSIVKRLSPELFWDVSIKELKAHRHEHFILERVLNWGNWQDWQAVKQHYGMAKARKVWRTARGLNAKSREFWRMVLN